MEVAVACQQQLLEALRPAQGIGPFKQADDRRRPQFAAAANIAVVARHQPGQFATLDRHSQASAHFLDQLGTTGLVAGMPG